MRDNKEKAKELYDKGFSLIQIANELNIPEGTVRSWKNRYKWSKRNAADKNATLQQLATIKAVAENKELTEKEKLFCIYFAKSLNATQSYKKAFNSNYNTANAEGYKLLVKPCVKVEIDRLKQERYTKAFLRAEDIFQKYMDIAFSDISDYMDFGMESQIDEETGQEYKFNYAHFKNADEIDGSIVSEVSFFSKGGAKIKLHDKLKALEWLADHMDLATEEQKLRIEKLKVETAKIKGDDNEEALNKLDDVLGNIKGVV